MAGLILSGLVGVAHVASSVIRSKSSSTSESSSQSSMSEYVPPGSVAVVAASSAPIIVISDASSAIPVIPDYVSVYPSYSHPLQSSSGYTVIGAPIPSIPIELQGQTSAPILVLNGGVQGYNDVAAICQRGHLLRASAVASGQPVHVSASVDLANRDGQTGEAGFDGRDGNNGFNGKDGSYPGGHGSRG